MFRAGSRSAVLPTTMVLVERSPALARTLRLCTGATRATEPPSRAMASASSSVSVVTFPSWRARPATTFTCPALTITRSVPMARSRSTTVRWAPSPTPTIAIMADTPTAIPIAAGQVRRR
jgi:hypothetical protein